MKVKRGLLYTASHEWVDFMPDGTARVGISDFVPQKRGKISFLNLCDEGEYYQSGEVIGDAERGAKLMTAQEYCKYLGKEAEMI